MTTSAMETTSMTATTSSSHVPTVRVGVRQFVRIEDWHETDNALRQHEHMCEILGSWLEAHTGIASAHWQREAAAKVKEETCSTR